MKRISSLLTRVADGNREAFGDVLEAFRNYLYALARNEIGDDLQSKGGPSDLVQETCLDAYRSIGSFQGRTEREFLAWLRTLMLNNLANFRRHYRSTGKRSIGKEVNLPADCSADIGDCHVEQLERQEDIHLLQDLIAKLPDDYRRVMTHWNEGSSFAEIGERMGRSPNAVRMLWMRSVRCLQQRLDFD